MINRAFILGTAGQGEAWLGEARRGLAWSGMARRGLAWLGTARRGEARHGSQIILTPLVSTARRGLARQGMARHGQAWHGQAWHGKARQGGARQGTDILIENPKTMKQRKIYYRRKEGKIVAEGKTKNKTIYLFALPEPEKVLKSSLFTPEKQAKIMEKIIRLDYKNEGVEKEDKKLRVTNIARTPKKDEKLLSDPDEIMSQVLDVYDKRKI